ncbi:MAG: DUF1285 domain-containing protein [Thermodesulfobacteriota bacterium]|nr:DUF1285 domain-containing protein [Thermodesulfobacteriota bacterium]
MEEILPCHIRIDKEGKWYYKGAEIIRRDIYLLFNQYLIKDGKGRFLLKINNEKCYLEVEDTPFIVKRVDLGKAFTIVLNDESEETLRLDTLWIGRHNVLYCKVKQNEFDARFNRPSYYDIAQYVTYNPLEDTYYIPFDGKKFYLKQEGG